MVAEITEQALTGRIAGLSTPSRLGVKTSLGPISHLLERTGHPERAFPSVHVGGTSGKGSTSTFLANILSDAGYSVGLFTKPHLSTVRERFVIDGEPITAQALLDLLDRLAEIMDEKPTWFELTVALAFQHFADRRVDLAVIEVGLGGALDATNVIVPELSVLTNVGLDHTDILGDTIEKIAADKLGIVKAGRPLVSGVTQPPVIQLAEEACARSGSPLWLVGRDYSAQNAAVQPEGSAFDCATPDEQLQALSIGMTGEHQVTNACTAAAAAVMLRRRGFNIPNAAVRSGLARTRVPGRMEIAGERPVIVLDGAHSPPKMAALAEGLRRLGAGERGRRLIGVLAFSSGHDADASLGALAPLLDAAVITQFEMVSDYGSKRAQDPGAVAAALRAMNPRAAVRVEPDPERALNLALELAGAEDLIVVTGSIFLVGQVREYTLARAQRR